MCQCYHDQRTVLDVSLLRLVQPLAEAPMHHSQALPRVCDIPPGRRLCSPSQGLLTSFLRTTWTIAEGYHSCSAVETDLSLFFSH